eukprot:9504972-Alexandrium_andersonii.AAC.2
MQLHIQRIQPLPHRHGHGGVLHLDVGLHELIDLAAARAEEDGPGECREPTCSTYDGLSLQGHGVQHVEEPQDKSGARARRHPCDGLP